MTNLFPKNYKRTLLSDFAKPSKFALCNDLLTPKSRCVAFD